MGENLGNILLHGDNIEGLQYLLEHGYRGKIDLIYIDPPFATGGDFTIDNGRASTISQSKGGEVAYSDRVKGTAFVEMIRQRLLLAKGLLSPKGSIYLHSDYKIGHYLRVMMDEVFGIENFRNDITRIKCNPKNFARLGYSNYKDMILFYTNSSQAIWHEPYEDYSLQDLQRLYPKIDAVGRRYTTVPIHAPGATKESERFRGMLPPQGRHWRTDVKTMEQWDEQGLIEWSANGNPRKIIYAEEQQGKRVQDIWTFKDPQYPVYPTEKNLDLLDLIIRTSSDIDSIVLDFYCGSGTTLKAAQLLGRRWVGIDASPLAIEASRNKLGLDNCELFASGEVLELSKPKATLIS